MVEHIHVVTHFADDDLDFSSDVYQIDVYCNEKLIKAYDDGDADSQVEQASGFVEGVKFCNPKVRTTYEDKADM